MVEARISELGLVLPEPVKPVASYVPTVRAGDLVYVSGQVPIRDGSVMVRGRVGEGGVGLEEAQACCRQCVLNGLAALKAEIGDLDLVRRVVRVGVFVSCGEGFGDQPKVANGASELLVEIFGEETGRHARAAVGCSSLPLNVPVEVEFVFQVPV